MLKRIPRWLKSDESHIKQRLVEAEDEENEGRSSAR